MNLNEGKMASRKIAENAKHLLKKLGLTSNQTVLDFGCGQGTYTIPAAQIVKPNGVIIAIDESNESLKKLNEKATKNNISNIKVLNSIENLYHITYKNEMDAILAFDVLHFLKKTKRTEIYEKFHYFLTQNGKIIIHPKHTKHDYPMWHFSNLTIPEFIEEVEDISFQLIKKETMMLLHDEKIQKGTILIFKKK